MEYNDDDDIHATRAITKLWACGEALKETNGAMRYMLDDVMVASGCSEKQEILTAWNDGRDHVTEHRRFVSDMVAETVDFMDSDDYNALDGDKKTDYWEVLRTTEKDLEKIDSQVFFYQLLSQIEHTEQTIDFLGPRLKESRDLILSRQLDGSLAHRGLILHKRRIMLLRNRLRYEIGNIMKLIDKAVSHPHFTSIINEKQKEYEAKWKAYANQLSEIDVD